MVGVYVCVSYTVKVQQNHLLITKKLTVILQGVFFQICVRQDEVWMTTEGYVLHMMNSLRMMMSCTNSSGASFLITSVVHIRAIQM